jgi:hypothetical protein
MSTRVAITVLIYLMVNTALFGIGLIIVLTISALPAHAIALVPTAVVVGSVLVIPVSSILALRLRTRCWRQCNASAAL